MDGDLERAQRALAAAVEYFEGQDQGKSDVRIALRGLEEVRRELEPR